MRLIFEFFEAMVIAAVGIFSLEAISLEYNQRKLNERKQTAEIK
ncbi:hypothetical protein [Celerinatantimonas diazotrophica]|uniref:Uncharacterized protein n=1 Tax=Celerinatantimonas diazotrophica TaxID=412034 RepID=A0A4R1J7V2_9GAMM|nr:hypothetical protein [Celerinatantimonas diazotrophica]TCK46384.1 hypothetical protein EV690_3660 [Celerinatantimonas diazotrophica]CAG9295242.1 hypothetical protein CEDIAZO_00354 [Celerinatantimonas diazotrophica]